MNNNSTTCNHIVVQVLLAVVLFFFSSSLYSQAIDFERIPNELGLSQNFISALCTDHDGYIWVGTKAGLNRFDGYQFKVFSHDPFDSLSISHDFIHSLFVDSKNRLWIGTEKGLNLYHPKKNQFTRISNFDNNASGIDLSSLTITSIVESKDGKIWLGTLQKGTIGLRFNDSNKKIFLEEINIVPPKIKSKKIWANKVEKLLVDINGTVWVNRFSYLCKISNEYEEIIIKWDEVLSQEWIPGSIKKETDLRKPQNINREFSIFQGKNNNIWLRTYNGIGKWNNKNSNFDFYPIDIDKTNISNSPLYGIGQIGLEDKNRNLWMGGIHGFVLYNFENKKIVSQSNYSDKENNNNKVYNAKSFLEDKSGNLWLGTNGSGLYKYAPLKKRFKNTNQTFSWNGKSIRAIYESKDGTLWFSDTDQHLYYWNRKEKDEPSFFYKENSEKEFAYVYSIHEDKKGNLWIGCENEFYRIIKQSDSSFDIKEYKFLKNFDTVYDIHEDPTGNIWLITGTSFGLFDQEEGIFYGLLYHKNKKEKINRGATPVIYQASDETFWLGTDEGLKKYKRGDKEFTHFINSPENRNSLSNNMVKTICPDPILPDSTLWIGTNNGLNRLNLFEQSFEHFNTQDGLPDKVVYGVLSDKLGQLWMSTNKGLARFSPIDNSFKVYTKEDGLQEDEFNSCAYFKSKNGELFWGGINGMNGFDPEDIQVSSFNPTIAINDVLFPVDKSGSSYKFTELINDDQLVLNYSQNIFTIEFAALDFTVPSRNQYAYLLENFNDDWQFNGNYHSATFTNLDPGEYIFKVKGTNHDGVWSNHEAELKIKIKRPLWLSWWAILIYLGLSAFLFYSLYRFLLKRQIEKNEAERLKELDVLKSKLYANITHEFRTPLTVIMGMTENINGHKNEKKLIKRNSENLLRLVNQLLDLSKIEDGKLKVEYINSDIIPYLKYLTESFQSLAQEKNIELVFYAESNSLNMDFDEVKVQQIVYNLLSNAIKFTPRNGQVIFHANQIKIKEKDFLNIKVKDNGIGIPKEKLSRIFDRFYQVDNSSTREGEGTGIGLALTKELTELMGGEIKAESKIENGTSILISLPIQQNALDKTTPNFPALKKEPSTVPTQIETSTIVEKRNNSELPILLLIEDNEDVATYIKSTLEKDYYIHWANNGQMGIEKALEVIPDIIISDVMMPLKDGFEVTRTLKNDEKTSHIPIILLTAKALESDKLDGLRAGADAYLMKPFNKEELMVRLEKLLSIRRSLMQRYQEDISWLRPSPPLIKERNEDAFDKEDEFLKKLREVVESNLDNTDFDVPQLCKSVHLSHTHVYRKLKALLDKTPSQFIRRIRLQKGLELLQSSDLNVSEVAYETGFSDPAYFSRMFSKEFGKPPSDFLK